MYRTYLASTYLINNGIVFENDSKDMTKYTKVDLGRRWMKNHRIGPDAVLQLSFQFAAATHYGYHVNHYEAGFTETSIEILIIHF